MAELPFVSVVTPTYNRRRFLPLAVACYRAQTYPKHRMEWVVIDDGEDDVSDFFAALTAAEPELNVRFIRHATRARIGAKRNELHREARGDIIVAWDDDDYYPPDRVSHVVESFAAAPDVQVAGCSTLYIYFSDVQLIYRLGPFTRRHATNGTMAVRRAFALTHFYDENVSHGEEESFLERFSYPMIQLTPLKVMLVMSHNSNTYNKEALRDNPRALSARTDLRLEHFIKDPAMCAAFAAQSVAAAAAFVPAAAPAAVPAAAQPDWAAVIREKAARAPVTVSISAAAKAYAPAVVTALQDSIKRATGSLVVTASGGDIAIMHVLDVAPPAGFLVVISGESWHQQRRADIVIAPVLTGNAATVIYYPFLYSSLGERRQLAVDANGDIVGAAGGAVDSALVDSSGNPLRPRFCAFMYSAPCPHRNKIFTEMRVALALSAKQTLDLTPSRTVDALGAQGRAEAPSTELTRHVFTPSETYNDIAVAKYRQYKYVLAIENAWVENYFTEKLINPILAGAVPLYWGHPAVFKYVNKARVVYIPDFDSVAALTGWLETRTDADWAQIVAQPWFTARGDPRAVQRRLEVDVDRAISIIAPKVKMQADVPTDVPSDVSSDVPTDVPTVVPTVVPTNLSKNETKPCLLAGLPPMYYINLDRRPDRRAHMEQMCAAYGVTATRVAATDGEAAAALVVAAPPTLRWGEVACTVSHLRAIQEWLASGAARGAARGATTSDTALICEDDLSFETVGSWQCDWRAVEAALPLYWDVIQLAIIYGPGDANMSLHYRANNDFSTCAYLIRRPYAQRLISSLWDTAAGRWSFPASPLRQAAEEVLYRPARCLSVPLFTYLDGAPGAAGAIGASDIQSAEHVNALHVRSRAATLQAWPQMTALKLLRM